MSRTIRNKSIQMRDDRSFGLEKKAKRRKTRDGRRTRCSRDCENNGGCPYCEKNKFHSLKKRESKANYSIQEIDYND